MYSIFDLLFDAPSYRPVYVISDSEIKELKKTQHQDQLKELLIKRKNLKRLTKLNLNILQKEKKS